jgi:hypothetical protein
VRKTVLRISLIAGLMVLAAAGTALAVRLQAGNVIVVADGGPTPTKLPRGHLAPIKLHGHGRIFTSDGSTPPILKTIELLFDKHGSVVTTGLPVCTKGKIAATDTAEARKQCAGSIVGKGFGKAVVLFPEQGPIHASSPITLFNGPPGKHGNPTVLAHAYLDVPAPTTYIISVEIQRIHDGRYGYKTLATLPRIAGGAGVPLYGELTIGRTWTYKGHKLSYINAECPDGRLEAEGTFGFEDGTKLTGSFVKKCTVIK